MTTAKRMAVLLLTALVLFLVLKFLLLPVRITGPSMLPTYRDGHINFINRLAYRHREPQRGDVVAIRSSGTSIMYFKRIVGMPGETVAFNDGKLLINGHVMAEPYVKYSNSTWDLRQKQLGPQDYYVVGDNRSMPIEDHYQGAAPRNRIVGQVLFGNGSAHQAPP